MAIKDILGSYLCTPDGRRILELLDDIEPDRLPRAGAELRDIDQAIGARELIRKLQVFQQRAEIALLKSKE